MKSLYDQLFQLLGKDTDDLEFKRLVTEIGEPSQVYEADDNIIYEFHEHGFGMTCKQSNKRFWMLAFDFATQSVKSGAVKPFREQVHAGINSTDCPANVEAKLGVKPKSFRGPQINSKHTGKYELLPYQFTCVFESQQGALEGMCVYAVDFGN